MRIAALILIAASLSACTTFRPITAEVRDPMSSLERAENARAAEARMHPACRDTQIDRDRQNEGCRDVVRRDR